MSDLEIKKYGKFGIIMFTKGEDSYPISEMYSIERAKKTYNKIFEEVPNVIEILDKLLSNKFKFVNVHSKGENKRYFYGREVNHIYSDSKYFLNLEGRGDSAPIIMFNLKYNDEILDGYFFYATIIDILLGFEIEFIDKKLNIFYLNHYDGDNTTYKKLEYNFRFEAILKIGYDLLNKNKMKDIFEINKIRKIHKRELNKEFILLTKRNGEYRTSLMNTTQFIDAYNIPNEGKIEYILIDNIKNYTDNLYDGLYSVEFIYKELNITYICNRMLIKNNKITLIYKDVRIVNIDIKDKKITVENISDNSRDIKILVEDII